MSSRSTQSVIEDRASGQLKISPVTVVVRAPDGGEQRRELSLRPLIIGSGVGAHIVVADAKVSRQHVELRLTEHGILVRDLKSKNGTRLGDVRLVEALLPANGRVTFGSSELRLIPDLPPAFVPLSKAGRFGEALTASVLMRAVFATLERAAASDVPVLLLGESGTGKEVLARGVHAASRRAKGPFVVFDCAAVAPSLIEAELFGTVKGAFTGADANRVGLAQEADGGTLFLDELGELPTELQPRLLRLLDAGEVRPVGSNRSRRVDLRVIAATHQDLFDMAREGKFRKDLLFRVFGINVQIPPLRERKEDIPLLASHFLGRVSPVWTLADLPPHALQMLSNHDWPGNVRELHNVLVSLVAFPEHVHLAPIKPRSRTPAAKDDERWRTQSFREGREEALAHFEAAFVESWVKSCDGNVTAAADAMQLSRQFVHRLMQRHGIKVRNG